LNRKTTDPTSPATLLRKVPFLANLDVAAIRDLAGSSRIVAAAKGEDIFVEGDPCRGMFLLIEGQMKIYRAAPSGREQIIAIEGPGATIAELPLFDGAPYPASCAATADSRLLLLPRDAFEDLLRRKPEIALGTIRLLGRRLRSLVALVDELSLLEVPQRLAKYLLAIYERRGAEFTLTQSNQEIASRLGTVREIVSRCLHRLEQQGAIEIQGRRIRVVDEDALRALIEEGR
jgi:CRP/FNR family transcriptional regulator